ncbi:hypothetical protein [Candidatus Hepatobacter penaei]|uniref:hypothetical protein n=1 Tax=Candidatus Hepatobacter penaei TaxID=1274402 RepID=UPI0012E05875|nr:hypothetical protein [Candidatus Hepatobacter penaei]
MALGIMVMSFVGWVGANDTSETKAAEEELKRTVVHLKHMRGQVVVWQKKMAAYIQSAQALLKHDLKAGGHKANDHAHQGGNKTQALKMKGASVAHSLYDSLKDLWKAQDAFLHAKENFVYFSHSDASSPLK